MKRALVTVSASTALAYCLVAGCTVFNDAPAPVYPADATDSASAAHDVEAGCARATIPSTPPDPKDGTGGALDLVFAITSVNLGVTGGKVDPNFGYDLDGVCTCAPDKPSCNDNGGDAGHCDTNLGRDDGVAALLAQLAAILDPASFADGDITAGTRGLLIRIQSYNGQANDDQVQFSLYRSTGTGGTLPDFTNPSQQWQVDSTDIESSGNDMYAARTTAPAFVKNHQLVVPQLASSSIPFNDDSDLTLQEVSFVATLGPNPAAPAQFLLTNLVGVGRWPLQDALNALAHVQDPTDSHQRICNDSLLLNAFVPQICAAADIAASSSLDNSGQTCSALSTAVEMDTAPAMFGAIIAVAPDNPCSGIAIPTCN